MEIKPGFGEQARLWYTTAKQRDNRAVRAEGAGEPGTVITADPKSGLVIACGSGAVRVLEVQAPGGKQMKAEDYLRGHGIPAGTDLKEDAQ